MKRIFTLFPIALLLISSHSFAQQKSYSMDKAYEISSNGTIELRSNDAQVRIIGTDRDNVRFTMKRELNFKSQRKADEYDFGFDVSESGDKLVFRERKNSGTNWNWMRETSYIIDMEVPRNVNLKIYGDDDDYYISKIKGDISLYAEDGDVEIVGCDGDKFDFRMDDGSVEMDGGSGKLNINGEDGDFIIHNGNFHSIRARMDDGDIVIATGLADGGEYNFEIQDGMVELEVLSGGGEIEMRTDDGGMRLSGNFDIRRSDEHYKKAYLNGGNASLSFRTDDGDIRIKTVDQ